eukprot:TRINITY_DN27398_c0_g1_i1.p1 TRINITY_DN27398_c0_g1~~TRINITY_DN27398_c0_g1_i1.p1  ORF type:complete len:232 (-),score=26.50 TRINITY_DN27398_c0_g1_i1:2-643(-)
MFIEQIRRLVACLNVDEYVECNVSGLGGHLCAITKSCNATVLDAKLSIEMSTSIPSCRQRLILDTVELRDTAILRKTTQTKVVDLTLIIRSNEEETWVQKALYGVSLQDAPPEICASPEIVLLAVTRDSKQLQYASADLRADREIVLSAVAGDPNALQHACASLQGRYDMQVRAGCSRIRLQAVKLYRRTSSILEDCRCVLRYIIWHYSGRCL